MEYIATEQAPAAVGPYSQAVRHGDFVFCSGQIPIDPATNAIAEGDVAVQTRQVLSNLAAVLTAAGSSLQQVLKTTVFLADMRDYAAMNEVYAMVFDPHRPARAAVEVARLPKDVRVEIECVASVLSQDLGLAT